MTGDEGWRRAMHDLAVAGIDSRTGAPVKAVDPELWAAYRQGLLDILTLPYDPERLDDLRARLATIGEHIDPDDMAEMQQFARVELARLDAEDADG